MTYLNSDLAIRRQLVEHISKLELQLQAEKEKNGVLENTVSEYSKKCDAQNEQFIDLVENVNYAASQIPRDHRRRILEVLPVL